MAESPQNGEGFGQQVIIGLSSAHRHLFNPHRPVDAPAPPNRICK